MKTRALSILGTSAILLCACTTHIDPTKFESVYRAGKGLSGALEVGVSILRYRELLGTFSAEVSIAVDKAQAHNERAMVQLYAEALVAFKDAEHVWAIQLQQNDDAGVVGIANDPEMKRIVEAYPINGEGVRDAFRFKPKEAVQTIWKTARGKLDAAELLYTVKQ